jgi:hypothetical protein
MEKYYKITARNAWDIIPIGPFESYEDAVKHLERGWGESLIQELTAEEIKQYVKTNYKITKNNHENND